MNILGRSTEDPEPQWRGPLLTGIFVGLFFIAALTPGWYGQPLRSKSVRLYCDQRLEQDCGVERAVKILQRVYSGRNFQVVERTAGGRGCGGEAGRIDVVADVVPGPAHSWVAGGCRYIGIDPDDPSFSSRTLAHEFGHHNFGDAGMAPGILTPLFNIVFDMRNDLIIAASL